MQEFTFYNLHRMKINLDNVFQQNADWPKVQSVLNQCSKKGYLSVINGGAVRDGLLGIAPKDFDIATQAHPDQILSLFPYAKEVGKSFGVICLPLGKKTYVEIATFRKDGQYLDGRRPSSVEFCTIKEDALRRDFTINALYYDPFQKEVLDYVNGLPDLKNKIIRTVGIADRRFREDYLRILRAIRFAVRFDFEIEKNTFQQMVKYMPKINQIAKERVVDEMNRTLQLEKFLTSVSYFEKTNLLKNLWTHWPWKNAKKTWVQHSFQNKPLFFWWLMLFAPIFSNYFDDLKTLLQQMNLSKEMIRSITDFVHFYQKLTSASSLGKKWILFHQKHGKDYLDLTLHFQKVLKKDSSFLKQAWTSYQNYIQRNGWPTPFLNGTDLIKEGIATGPQISYLLQVVFEAQLESRVKNKKDALKMIREKSFDAE